MFILFLIIAVLIIILINNNNKETFETHNVMLKELCPLLKKHNPYYSKLEDVINHYNILIDNNNAIIKKYLYNINDYKRKMKELSNIEHLKERINKENAEEQIKCNRKFKNKIEDALL